MLLTASFLAYGRATRLEMPEGSRSDVPLTRVVHLSLQLGFNVLLWWWTAHLLLQGRVSWRALLPGAVVSAVLVVLLRREGVGRALEARTRRRAARLVRKEAGAPTANLTG